MKRCIRWFILSVVKPCFMLWIIMEGLPGVIRAIGQAGKTLVKAFE